MTREKVVVQMPTWRIIDGERKDADAIKDSSSAANLADRVMEENGDSLPFEIIEGGRTAETINDREVPGPKGILRVVWDSARAAETEENQKSAGNMSGFLGKIKKFLNLVK